ncbi:MAG: 30S ribosomal protein S7 [Candidatus Paceibacteria bacterium]
MRKKRKFKREYAPDPLYGNSLVGRFINQVMRKGKKTKAQKIVYGAFEKIKQDTKTDPLVVFEQAIKNVSPLLEVRSRRIGGANYQVPVEVRGERRITLAMRWILQAARSRQGKPMHIKLAEELIAASKNEGAAIKKKLDTHRMAEANKAFAHFAW